MTLPGFDISEAQGGINWAAVPAAGQAFVFIKAWEHRADRQWSANWAGAKTAGLARGAYCFARPGNYNPVTQAQAFCAQAGKPQPGDLPLVLDLEDAGGLGPNDLVRWAAAFLNECDTETGRRSILYTYSGFLSSSLDNDTRLAGWPLWIANYKATPPNTRWPWTFWQHADNGHIAGIAGAVDTNVFSRGATELAYLTASSSTAPTPAPQPASSPAPQVSEVDPMAIPVPGATPLPAFGNRFPYWSVKGKQILGFNGAPIQGGSSGFGVSFVDVPAPSDLTGLFLAADGVTLVATHDGDGGTYTYRWK